MPESGICIFDNLTDTKGIISPKNYGYGFYSTYLEKNTVLKSGIIKLIVNKEDIYKLIIFDHLVYNKDRNPGNLLVEFKSKSIYLTVIDHSHVFKNQTIWDKHCFEIGIKEQDFTDQDIICNNNTLYSMFYRNISITKEQLLKIGRAYKEILTSDVLSSIISSTPSEWETNVSDLEALKEYLIYRLAHVDEICDMIIGYIKQ